MNTPEPAQPARLCCLSVEGDEHLPACRSRDTITLTLDRAAADALAHAWEMDWPLTTPVRVLLDGHDGYLHLLNAALGRPH